jgi:hypothetical protein
MHRGEVDLDDLVVVGVGVGGEKLWSQQQTHHELAFQAADVPANDSAALAMSAREVAFK